MLSSFSVVHGQRHLRFSCVLVFTMFSIELTQLLMYPQRAFVLLSHGTSVPGFLPRCHRGAEAVARTILPFQGGISWY